VHYFFGFKIDGNWVDLSSLALGTLWAVKQGLHRRRAAKELVQPIPPFFDRRAGSDFATGTSLCPFVILTLSPFSSELLAGLLQGGRVVLAVAGAIALASIVRDT
jgi:hypothetical protein